MAAIRSDMPGQTFLGRVCKRARKSNIEVSMSVDALRALWNYQSAGGETRFAYTGTLLYYSGTRPHESNASLDRVDSSKGYVEGNVCFSTKQANISKHTMSVERLLYLCNQMTTPILLSYADGKIERSKQYRGSQTLSAERLAGFKRSARLDKREFDIDIEYIKILEEGQNFRCALSGEWLFPDVTSIDRIDNSKGYIKGNIQLTTKEINLMRGAMSMEQFRSFVDDVYEWNFILRKGLVR